MDVPTALTRSPLCHKSLTSALFFPNYSIPHAQKCASYIHKLSIVIYFSIGLTCCANIVDTATKETPFFAAYHLHPENNFKNLRDNATKSHNPKAVKAVEDLDAMTESMRENMKAPQTWIAKYYNQKAANKEPQFKGEDLVIVNTKNIKPKRQSKKLD